MGYIVDPRPGVEAELERLRAEHEPKIREAEQALADADKADRPAAKQFLKERRAAYKQARRQAKAILRGPMSW